MTDCEHSPTMRLFAINTVPGADGCPICLAAENAALREKVAAYEVVRLQLTERGDNYLRECVALRKDAKRLRDDAMDYHRIMGWLRATKMQHGQCQPRERLACTHCNAVDNLEAAITAYRGQPVILAAAMEQNDE